MNINLNAFIYFLKNQRPGHCGPGLWTNPVSDYCMRMR